MASTNFDHADQKIKYSFLVQKIVKMKGYMVNKKGCIDYFEMHASWHGITQKRKEKERYLFTIESDS